MTYSESIKRGFGLIHRQWQLVLVQLALSVIGCIGFFVIVGIPLIAMVISLGLDVAELTRLKDFVSQVENPFDLIRRYLGIGLVLLAAIMLYALFAFSLWVYGLGGSAGMIAAALAEPDHRFSVRGFMANAKRHFLPLLGYTALVGALLIGALFVLGIFGGLSVAAAAFLKENLMGKFLSVFFAIVSILSALALMIVSMAVTLFGAGILAIENTGAVETLKRTFRRLRERPAAIGLFIVVFVSYIFAYATATGLSVFLSLIPLVGQILLLPYQLFMYALQGYLNLVMLAVLMAYYYGRVTPMPPAPPLSGSSPASDIFPGEASHETLPPPESAGQEEAGR